MGRKGLWRHILWAEFLVHLGAAAPEMDGVFLKVCPGALRVVCVEGALTAVPRCDGIRAGGAVCTHCASARSREWPSDPVEPRPRALFI